MSEVYAISDSSKVVYVGQTTRGYKKRFREHKRHLGLDSSYTVKVIKECPVEELDKWEKHYIAKYDTLQNGLNKTDGGKAPRGYSIPPRRQSVEERTKRSQKLKVDNPLFCKKAREKKAKTMKRLYSTGELTNPNSKEWTIEFSNGVIEKVFALKKYCESNGYSYNNVYSAFKRESGYRDIKSIKRN